MVAARHLEAVGRGDQEQGQRQAGGVDGFGGGKVRPRAGTVVGRHSREVVAGRLGREQEQLWVGMAGDKDENGRVRRREQPGTTGSVGGSSWGRSYLLYYILNFLYNI